MTAGTRKLDEFLQAFETPPPPETTITLDARLRRHHARSTTTDTLPRLFIQIAEYVRYDNFDRRHSGIDYCSPAQFEQIINKQK